MRFLIARRARNPLLAHLILRGSEPFLRQHFHQSCLQVENEERECRLVIRHRLVAGRHDQFIDTLPVPGGHFDLVHARSERERHLELRDRRGLRVDAVGRLLEPSRNLRRSNAFELIGIETGKTNVAALRAPDAKTTRR
jgi:hypothetical protein